MTHVSISISRTRLLLILLECRWSCSRCAGMAATSIPWCCTRWRWRIMSMPKLLLSVVAALLLYSCCVALVSQLCGSGWVCPMLMGYCYAIGYEGHHTYLSYASRSSNPTPHTSTHRIHSSILTPHARTCDCHWTTTHAMKWTTHSTIWIYIDDSINSLLA